MRLVRTAAPAALALALAALAVARAEADQRIVAAPVTRYVTPELTIAPGEPLTFANQDPLLLHNLVARDTSPDGRPIFGTATIAGGEETPVFGSDKLPPGSYGFFCTIHPTQMNGMLTVDGIPVEPDVSPPTLQARIDSSSLRSLERRRALLVTLTSDETIRGMVAARAFGVTLATRSISLGPGSTAVALKLSAAGLRGLRKRKRVKLTLSLGAQDGAGNTGTVSASRTLRRAS